MFPYINPESPESINSIKDTNDAQRSKAKAPHFALQYLGTWATLVANCGFSKDEAKRIEERYKRMFKVSYDWVEAKLDQASIDGYVTLAFGLRLRTPILAKTILGNGFTPKQAAAESRTAGNAVSGQSYGLLNSRAGVEFQERLLNSEYALDIRPSIHIHDAQYFMIRDDVKIVEWVNNNLVECVEWQDLPELHHPEIKLTGELGIFYPAWHNEITLKHNSSEIDLLNTCAKGKAKYYAKKYLSSLNQTELNELTSKYTTEVFSESKDSIEYLMGNHLFDVYKLIK